MLWHQVHLSTLRQQRCWATGNGQEGTWSFIQTSPLFSDNQSFLLSPFCPPAARILADGRCTSMGCAAEIDEIQKKDILGWWERRKGRRHFQAAVLRFAILPQITPVEFFRCRRTIWWSMIYKIIRTHHVYWIIIQVSFAVNPSQGPSYTLRHPCPNEA